MSKREFVNYHTYLLIMKEINGLRYCKVGITTDIKKRLRNYELHNPAISAVLLCENEEHEQDILWTFKECRIDKSEWFCTPSTTDEIITEINRWGNFVLIQSIKNHKGEII